MLQYIINLWENIVWDFLTYLPYWGREMSTVSSMADEVTRS